MRLFPRFVPIVGITPFLAAILAGSPIRQVSRIPLGGTAPAVTSPSTKAADTLPSLELPSLPPGVSELKFRDFFRQPVGPRGLEVSEKIRQLDGQRVRILGYMVEQSQPTAHRLMLCTMPITLHEDEWGFCEDLPAAVVYVFVDPSAPEFVPFTPGPLLLTGKLSVGTRLEPDERVSVVRLQLDAPPTAATSPMAKASAP